MQNACPNKTKNKRNVPWFVLCTLFIFMYCFIFLAYRYVLLAILALVIPTLALLSFWMLSGQELVNLYYYFLRMIPIISGYSWAQAYSSHGIRGYIEEILYALLACWLLFSIIKQKQFTNACKWILFSMVMLYLFVAFKEGFVRHDGHAITAAEALLIAAGLLSFLTEFIYRKRLLILALILCLLINAQWEKTSISLIKNRFMNTYSLAWEGMIHSLQDPHWLQLRYQDALTTIRMQNPLPTLPGKTDIYSFNQSSLIASNNTWSPRPIIQSYSAYTPTLSALNRDHLLGKQAPDNIFFQPAAINHKFPSLEDGASWPILLSYYHLVSVDKNYVLLHRNIKPEFKPLVVIANGSYSLNKTVFLPPFKQLLFVRIHLQPTLLGKMIVLFYKPIPLTITCVLMDGRTMTFSFIPLMAESDFLLSPLIETTEEFAKLYQQQSSLQNKQVRSIRIDTLGGRYSMFWQNHYTATFLTS